MMIYFLCLILFCVGLYGILRKRNIIKIIISCIIAEYAVNLFLILIAYRVEGRVPISTQDATVLNMVDALPQAVVLTTLVIGLSMTMLLVTMAIRIYEKYGTFDITKIRDLKR